MAELRHDTLRLARLVDSLLALERVEEGGPELEPLRLDFLVRETVDAQDPGRVHLGAVDVVTVNGDNDALRRALANLIENGLVHGPRAGGVTVWLERDEDIARLSVVDEGEGPDPAEHDRLFERFWRGSGASERPGSGLGLSIVAAIAERHGGRVLVNGPRFTIELPRVQPEPPVA
jgi:signal transduction histidine kinase